MDFKLFEVVEVFSYQLVFSKVNFWSLVLCTCVSGNSSSCNSTKHPGWSYNNTKQQKELSQEDFETQNGTEQKKQTNKLTKCCFLCNSETGRYNDEDGYDVSGGLGSKMEGFCKLLKIAIFFLVVLHKIMSIKR